MNLTKSDVLELRKRMSKNHCTITNVCGCYVNSEKNVLLKFNQPFVDLEDDDYFKYLEIAKKVLSGTVGNNMLELEFARNEEARERQTFLNTFRSSKLKNEQLLDRLYEQIIENYDEPSNYLILVFHDIYDVITKAKDKTKLDESEEVYEYIMCAICPVELSKPALGYDEDENKISARERDWLVNMPMVGFTYPAFCQRSSDVNAVMYYVKDAKNTKAEFAQNTLGVTMKRTATQEKTSFENVVKNAFGAQEKEAEIALYKIQNTLNEIISEGENQDESLIPMSISQITEVIQDIDMEEDTKLEITREYAREFGDIPTVAQNIFDGKFLESNRQKVRTAELEKQVLDLKDELSQSKEPIKHDKVVIKIAKDKENTISTQVIEGKKCLIIPIEDEQIVEINQ